MPGAPARREDELQRGNRTLFEFTGTAASESESKRTFIGGHDLDLGSTSHENRESNLRSGATTWIFLGVTLLCGAAVAAFFILEATEHATASTPGEGPAATPPGASDPVAGGAAPAGESTDAAAAAAKAEAEAKAKAEEQAKAEAEAKAKAEAEAKAKAEAEAKAKAEAEAKAKAKAKKPPSKKSSGSKKKTIKPKKPPRDPLKGLPAPPG